MTLQKPSDKEEEYFAREEYERLKALAAKQAKEEKEKERKERKDLHYMHCPKCGGDLVEIVFKDVHIDKCTLCEGIWLDAGELEEVINKQDTTLMKKVLQVFR
ncbi:MAG: zf-TFIIB domain-containing protein [Proteobacteria bacterium]|nr:zf-TFIIB domain-containing protein [Pseudomonadota bacterium]